MRVLSGSLMFGITVLKLVSLPVINSQDGGVCKEQYIDRPIAAKDGDFIIGGMFQIGKLQNTSDKNGTQIPVYHCSYDKSREYSIQKAIVFRMLIDEANERLKSIFNKTLGYEIYDTCMNSAVTLRASVSLANNRKVIGVSGVDIKSLVKRSVGVTTSFRIPTFVYMFNDDDLMSAHRYPTLFSMIDTEIKEAEITIRFLELMGYQYMDIWYHKFSKEMAEHIYNSYVRKVGCGRITNITYKSHIPKMRQTYNDTGGTPSQVQMILQNSRFTTKAILEEMVGDLGFRDKIYILGLSNGRDKYVNEYAKILNNSGSNTIILPLPDLLNTQLHQTEKYLNQDWRQMDKRDDIDDIYRNVQSRRCAKDTDEPKSCKFTSWLPYMVGGIQLILETLRMTLKNNVEPKMDCEMDYKTEFYNEIIKENQTVNISLEENINVSIRMFSKTINTGYKIGVYRTEENKFRTLGRAFFDGIEVADKDLLDSISGYNKTCSHTCNPGTHRLFDESVQYVPCCWTCELCPLNQYSTELDVNMCDSCNTTMTSTDNRTGCSGTPEVYMRPYSTLFIVGASSVPVGLAAVIVIGVFIFRNETRPLIKASDPGYLYMILLGLLIGYSTAFIPFLPPTHVTCSAEYYSFVIFATFISVNLLLKCLKVYDIFAAAKNFTTPRLGLFLRRTGQTTVNVITLATTIGILVVDIYTGVGPSWAFSRYQKMPHDAWYLTCTAVDIFLLVPLIIPGLSFLVTLVLAFKMRQFPHNFRESLNIFCATFVVLLCAIMFLTGYTFSTPEIQPILRAIVIFVTSTAFLCCLFIPKILILWNSDLDVEQERESIRERVKRFSKA